MSHKKLNLKSKCLINTRTSNLKKEERRMAYLNTKRQPVCQGRTAKTYAEPKRLVFVTLTFTTLQSQIRMRGETA